MGVQRRYVPHLKGLIYGKVEPEAQGRDSTFTFRHAQWKKAILHLKRPKVPRLFLGTVQQNHVILLHTAYFLSYKKDAVMNGSSK